MSRAREYSIAAISWLWCCAVLLFLSDLNSCRLTWAAQGSDDMVAGTAKKRRYEGKHRKEETQAIAGGSSSSAPAATPTQSTSTGTLDLSSNALKHILKK